MRGDFRVEVHSSVLDPTDENGDAEDEQRVREDRSDERGLDHLHEAGAQTERADEKLGKIAERRLENSGRAGIEMRADVFGAARHVHREQRQRDGGGGELHDRATAHEVQQRRDDERRSGHCEDDDVGAFEHGGKYLD